MTVRAYDYRPLARRSGLLGRVRAIGTDPLMVIGSTIGFLLLAIPVVGIVVMVAVRDFDGGAIAFLAFLLICGGFVAADVLGRTGSTDALASFASRNHLILLPAGQATEYAGSRFADDTMWVQHAVRTPGDDFVEIGDCILGPRNGPRSSALHLYLRARLTGRVPDDADLVTLMPADVSARLPELTGGFSIEARGSELTVFGVEPLQPHREHRVATAFDLLDQLVASIEAAYHLPVRLTPAVGEQALDAHTPSGRARWSTWKIIGGTLLLLIVGPLLFAIVMSILDDYLRGRYILAKIVVSLLVLLMVALIGRLVNRVARGRRR